MATTPIPLPQQQTQGDPGLSGSDPRAILAAISAGHTQGSGTTSIGTQIPMPQPRTLMEGSPNSGVAQGSFATKGAHQRASLQNLTGSVQNLVSTAVNIHQQQQNKQLGQKFSTLTGSVKGVQAADEMMKNAQAMLQQDPNSQQGQQMLQQAQQMKQHNTTILNQLLDPNTPEGKKNIKLFNKGFGFDDKNADTPERAAAIAAMQQQNKDLNQGAAGMLSQMPTGIGMSPQTQVQGEMVKAGVTPKAATQGQILHEQGSAAKTLTTDEQKQQALRLNQTRLGMDENNKPLPLESLPVAQQAKIAGERASEQVKYAQAQLAQARQSALADPNSPQNQLALMRARAMSSFAGSAAIRAQVMQLNYLMNARGVGADGQPLPGSQSIGGSPVGTRLAGQAIKTLQAQAAFTDVDGALDNLDAAAKTLASTGQRINDPRLVKLMTDPHFKSGDMDSFQNWISSGVASSLSPEQRDYLIAQRQAKENITAIRRYTGGGVAQKQVDAMYGTLPGATTPDYDTVSRQIKAVKGQIGRLHTAIPSMNVEEPETPNQRKIGGGLNLPPSSDMDKADPMGLFK
jgi:hypothetical protein